MCGFKHVSNEPPCSNVLCPWLWKIWQLPNIEIHCVMPLYVEVVIDLMWRWLSALIRFEGFEQGDYVYLQQITPTILDVIARHVILCVQKVLPSGMLLLEGWDGQTWKDHVRNCAPCHLPNVDGQVDPSLTVVLVGLSCMLCGQT